MTSPDVIRERVGRAISRWRKRHAKALGKANFSRNSLAVLLSCTERTVVRWELGETAPDAVELAQMAEVFGCEVNELFS